MSNFHKTDDVIPENLVYDIDLMLFLRFKVYNDDVIPVTAQGSR
jgi:hypothetical protein